MSKVERKTARIARQGTTAIFKPETVDRENRTVEVVMTTGESGKRYDWRSDRYYLEELQIDDKSMRTARLKKGLPLIADHSRYSGIRGVLGTTESYRFENGELIGTLRFSKREEVQPIFDDVADGILRHVSLGYKVHKYERIRGKNEGELDTYRAVDLEPLEISLVQVPFESTNGVRGERADENETYEVVIEERSMSKANAENNNNVQAQKTEQPKQTERQEQTTVVETQTQTREQEQPTVDASAIRGELPPMIEACEQGGVDREFAIEHFGKGTKLDEFRGLVLAKVSERSQGQNIVTQGSNKHVNSERQDAHEQTIRSIENQLEYRANPNDIKLEDGARQFNGMSLMEIGRELLESKGISTRGMSKMALAERALHSTSDFPTILANVMNKSLRGSYQEVPRTFMEFGRRASVSDFRPVHRMALGDAPDLKKLNEHGEFTRGSMGEEGEQYKIATYGRIFGITRQTLINDDLDAFTRLPSMWGASSARLQNRLFWGMILGYDFDKGAAAPYLMADGKDVYHADHKNLIAGANSAFGETGFSALRKAGRKVKTIDGNNMNLTFNKLALPAELETKAEKELMSILMPNTVADTTPFRGKFNFVIEPLLDEVSTTAWYGFANTNQIDTFEYAFLNGEEELNIETRNGFDIDGFEVRARTDVGGGWVDRRGAIKMVGA